MAKEKIDGEENFSDITKVFDFILEDLREKHRLTDKEIINLLKKRIETKKEFSLPVNIFEDRKLGALESVVKYMKEELNLSYHEIAVHLSRDDRTIWSSYNSSSKKRKEPFSIRESKYNIPLSALGNSKLGILEAVVLYLKNNLNLRYRSIAQILNRDERTIWTTYQRATKKNGK
jgi:hypothetical protein